MKNTAMIYVITFLLLWVTNAQAETVRCIIQKKFHISVELPRGTRRDFAVPRSIGLAPLQFESVYSARHKFKHEGGNIEYFSDFDVIGPDGTVSEDLTKYKFEKNLYRHPQIFRGEIIIAKEGGFKGEFVAVDANQRKWACAMFFPPRAPSFNGFSAYTFEDGVLMRMDILVKLDDVNRFGKTFWQDVLRRHLSKVSVKKQA